MNERPAGWLELLFGGAGVAWVIVGILSLLIDMDADGDDHDEPV